MKVGDLVRIKGMSKNDEPMLGIITDLSEPCPAFPVQVATVVMTHDNQIVEGISVRSLEVLSESL